MPRCREFRCCRCTSRDTAASDARRARACRRIRTIRALGAGAGISRNAGFTWNRHPRTGNKATTSEKMAAPAGAASLSQSPVSLAYLGPVVDPVQVLQPLVHGAVLGHVERVEDDEAAAVSGVQISCATAGRVPGSVALQQHRAAAGHHRRAFLIDKGAVRAAGAADSFLVVVGGDVGVAAVIDRNE